MAFSSSVFLALEKRSDLECKIELSDVADEAEAEAEVPAPAAKPKVACSFEKVKKKYLAMRKDDPEGTKHINFYRFCSQQQGPSSKPVVPNIHGHKAEPTWPLQESHSKAILTIYKPFLESIESLQTDGS